MSQSKSPETASKNLQIIRSLMERATIYEAISAPSAFCASMVAMLTAAMTWSADPEIFLVAWMVAVAVANAINLFFLARGSTKRGDPVFSPGMRHTLRAIAPPLLTGAIIGSAFVLCDGNTLLSSACWAAFYGIALLSMQGFAPKSMIALGWAFTLAGTTSAVLVISAADALPSHLQNPSLLMAITFGLFHLGYAICVPFSRSTGE